MEYGQGVSQKLRRPGGRTLVRPTSAASPAPPSRLPSRRRAASASQSSLRDTNLALVAQHVFASPAPLSRADVAAATGMTRSTASRLVDALVAAHLLAELPPAASSGPGRPAVPLVPARGTVAALGLEVNVSRMAVRAIDLSGAVLAERVVHADLAGSDPTATLSRLADLMEQVLEAPALARARLAGAALALPGLVSEGTLLRAPNLGWSGVAPATRLASRLDPVGGRLLVGNEADFGALVAARTRPGAQAQTHDFIYLSGENGIGAGLVRDGVVIHGSAGFAGEVGHVQVAPDGPECGCGNRGCLERYAGRRVILTGAGLGEDASPDQLVRAWQEGREEARASVSAAAHALAVALSAAINILDIPAVVLGGHLAPLTEVLRPELEPELSRRVLASPWSPPRVLPAPSDETPGATGAAWAVLEGVVANPAEWV
ncbi:ROK family protein [Actinomyces lilanjuaniae]|uniref:ROK family protein n=1 Tax=Actinomyces lilanjuaniae TaxID=2321394 RepID=A0ABN5PQ76_9ACTO|nr:ROK family protein [Actinomyces lilanjuaniae]